MAKIVFSDLKLFFVLVFASLLIFAFDHFGLFNGPKFLLQYLTVPIQYGLYDSTQGLNKQVQSFLLVRRAVLEDRALRIQLGELLTENAALRQQLAETQILVAQYNKLSPETYDLLPARIIGNNRYFTLDKGSSDGVKVGQAVVYKDNLVGQIKSVSPKSSEVILIEDPDSKINVFSQGSSGTAKGILTGEFGTDLLMDKILHDEIISDGDLVYSQGIDGKLPKGLVMGKVSNVLQRQNEVFKQAQVTPLFKVDDLDIVFVIRN